jgi:hypothetical protein
MEVSGQLYAPAALLPGVRAPGTPWIGCWVGSRPGPRPLWNPTDCMAPESQNALQGTFLPNFMKIIPCFQ